MEKGADLSQMLNVCKLVVEQELSSEGRDSRLTTALRPEVRVSAEKSVRASA